MLALIAPPSHSPETQNKVQSAPVLGQATGGSSCLPLFWASNAAEMESRTNEISEPACLPPAGITRTPALLAGGQQLCQCCPSQLDFWGDRLAGGYLGSHRAPDPQGIHRSVCSTLLSSFPSPAFQWGEGCFLIILKWSKRTQAPDPDKQRPEQCHWPGLDAGTGCTLLGAPKPCLQNQH